MFDIAVTSLVSTLGYLGIIILMAIESSFIPLPSEVILIPAGYLVYAGHMNFFLVFIASVIGSFIGSAISYGIGKKLGRAYLLSHSKMFFIEKEKLLKVDDYFKNHGSVTVFVSRLVFGVRHVISLVAGFANMDFWRFIGWTVLGASVWNLFLISLGYYVGGQVSGSVVNYVNLIGAAVVTIAVTVIGIIYMKRRVKI